MSEKLSEDLYLAEQGTIGILGLRLRHQTVEMVNAILQRFLTSGALSEEVLCRSLVVVSENQYRIYQGPRGTF